MGGEGIHMQLPYMVINMWSINVWEEALMCSYQYVGGGGIHVQLPYTVINVWRINTWRGH